MPYCCENGAQNANCALPTPPPLPSFLPKINLPSIIPVKPTQAPQQKRPIPPFPPIVNLPSIIPIRPTPAPKLPVKPIYTPPPPPRISPVVVSKPAPFVIEKSLPVKPVAPIISNQKLKDYLPPKIEPEDEWQEWKVIKFKNLFLFIHVLLYLLTEKI